MKLQALPFEQIRIGTKTIEIRLDDEKRQAVQAGDEIEFANMVNQGDTTLTRVVALHHLPTFKALFEAFRPEMLGATSADDYEKMYTYYSPEDEAKYGVLGIEIERV